MKVSKHLISMCMLCILALVFLIPVSAQDEFPHPREGNDQPPIIEPRNGRAPAKSFTVNTYVDSPDVNELDYECRDPNNLCSLRAAIMQANFLDPGSVITVPAGIYQLSLAGTNENLSATGDLDIRQNMTIIGAGAGVTVIDGLNLDSVFEIATGHTVQLRFMSIINGKRSGGDLSGTGGAIRIAGNSNVTLNAVTVSNSFAGYGGGIEVDTSNLTLIQSTVSNNTSNYTGAGIDMFGTSSLTASNSTISGNRAGAHGGGIQAENGALVNLTSVTLAFNTAGTTSVGQGGGVNIIGSVSASNSIFANNIADVNSNCSGTLSSDGTNLLSNKTGCAGTTGDALADPLLQALAIQGPGLTPTHALPANSPAVNTGAPGCNPASTDQRGVSRVMGVACDIGAFEYSEQYVANWDFEVLAPNSSSIPAHWILKKTTKEKVKCNKPSKSFSQSQNCAFMFKSDIAYKKAKIQQLPNTNTVNTNDVLVMSGFVRGKNLTVNAVRLQTTVKYTDGLADKIKITVPNGSFTYRHFIDNIIVDPKPIAKMKVMVKFNSGTGKAFVDAISLVETTSVAALRNVIPGLDDNLIIPNADIPLPLPPASIDE